MPSTAAVGLIGLILLLFRVLLLAAARGCALAAACSVSAGLAAIELIQLFCLLAKSCVDALYAGVIILIRKIGLQLFIQQLLHVR